MARRDPTVGGALVEGIVLSPHPPFHSMPSASTTPRALARWWGCGGFLHGAVGVIHTKHDLHLFCTPSVPCPPHRPSTLHTPAGWPVRELWSIRRAWGSFGGPHVKTIPCVTVCLTAMPTPLHKIQLATRYGAKLATATASTGAIQQQRPRQHSCCGATPQEEL